MGRGVVVLRDVCICVCARVESSSRKAKLNRMLSFVPVDPIVEYQSEL